MQTITTQAKLAFETSPVKRKYKVFIDWISKGTVTGTVTAGEFNSTYFPKANVTNDEDYIIYKPFILSDSMRLGDNVRLVSNKYENGWLGANRSNASGVFASAEVISMIYTLTTPSNHITVFGSRYNYPVNMNLYYRNSIDTAWVLCQSYTNITSYITIYIFPTLTTIKGWKVEITKINLANMFACIAEVQTGFREDVSADLTLNPMDIDKQLEYDKGSINIGNISANILTLRLNNTTQKYNPENVNSYLYPFLKYNKIIQPFIGIDLGDSIEWFAQGKYYLRAIDPKPDMTVEIYAVDGLYFLNAEDFSSSIVYENYTKSQLQQMLVENFGLGVTEYAIDATTSVIPYAYFESLKYAEAIKRLEIADGGVAFFDELGIFNSKTRGWTESGVAAYYDDSTIKKDSASSPVISNSMKNYIRIKSNPLDSAAQEVVYNSSQSIVVPGGGLVVCDNYSESNFDGTYSYIGFGLYDGQGQTFTGNGGVLDSCKFYLKKYGSPTGSAYAKVYAHTGTWGTDGKPTGGVLATSDAFEIANLSTSYQLISLTFSGANKITPTGGTHYCLIFESTAGDNSNYILAGFDSSSPTHGGNGCYLYNGSWGIDNASDIIFYIYTGTGVTYTKDVACYFTKKPCIDIIDATFTQSSTHIKVISESKYSFVTFLTFTNTGAVDESILTIEIQAKPLAATGANEVVSQDVDLIAIYGKSEYLIDSEFIQDMVTAQTLADDLLVAYKDPEALELEIEATTKPYLQLGDTVMIRNSKLSIGG